MLAGACIRRLRQRWIPALVLPSVLGVAIRRIRGALGGHVDASCPPRAGVQPKRKLFLFHRRWVYLSSRSFLTVFTPCTERAISAALVRLAALSTKPLSCTTPSYVSTLICSTLSEGSLRIAVFTLVVTQLSPM